MLQHGSMKSILQGVRQDHLRQQKRLRAALLAGAVTFTGKSGIEIYDKQTDRNGVNAEVVLAEWEPPHVWALLERGIFSDAIYNMVGFRHREIRDYLSAKWLDSLLKKGIPEESLNPSYFVICMVNRLSLLDSVH